MTAKYDHAQQVAIGRHVHHTRRNKRYGRLKPLELEYDRSRYQLWRYEQVFLAHCLATGEDPGPKLLWDVSRETTVAHATGNLASATL